ncbi:hypothetical protein WDU94_010878 [Cyamophila willieti]
MDNFHLIVLFCWCFMSTANGLNDVTTMYELDTLESDMDDVEYLNACKVSVHVPAKDTQLPLFKMNSNDRWGTNIPPLYNKWKRLDGTEILISTTKIHEAMLNFRHFNMNIPPISNLLSHKKFKDINMHNSGLVVNENDMDAIYKNAVSLPFNTLAVSFMKTNPPKTRLYWDENDGHFIEISISSKDKLTVCYYNENIDCKESKFSYADFGNDPVNTDTKRIIITLNDQLVISDVYSPLELHTNFYLPVGFTRYTRVKHVHDGTPNVWYSFFEAKSTNNIVSPWLEIKTNTAAFIVYFAKTGHVVNASLEDETTKEVVQLAGHELRRVNHTAELEIVLTKVNIPSWTGKKRIRLDGDNIVIGNIWEKKDQYKVQRPKNCTKSNLMDVYNTFEFDSTRKPVDSCSNGGRLKNDACACPPGFGGIQCEVACGRNRFGQTCSSLCSKTSNQCKGRILCTPDYGCTCAPGYYGDQCIQQCTEGTFGADCTQRCDQCKNGCDRYTGACRGECSKPYLIRPYCRQTHSYLKEAPEIVDTSFNSVKLLVNLTPKNVERSSVNEMFYLVQYREDNSNVWDDGPTEVFSPIMSNILVEGLNPGRVYEFRVLLIDESRESQDPSLSKLTRGITKCSVSVSQEYLHVDTITNISIGLSWDNETGARITECPTMNYLLEVDEATDTEYMKTRNIVNIKRNSYQLKTLSPGQTYYIKLKKITINGETVIASKNVTTDDTVDLSNEVVGVTIEKTDSQIKIDWFPIPLYKKYFVKYKLIRFISCNEDTMKYPLEVKETSNTTLSLSILDLEPYAYYELFVTVDQNQMMKEFNSSFITPGTVPTDSPTVIIRSKGYK